VNYPLQMPVTHWAAERAAAVPAASRRGRAVCRTRTDAPRIWPQGLRRSQWKRQSPTFHAPRLGAWEAVDVQDLVRVARDDDIELRVLCDALIARDERRAPGRVHLARGEGVDARLFAPEALPLR